MVRKEKYRHNLITGIADDPAYDVGSGEWNDDHNNSGMFGHTPQTLAISGGAVLITDDMHIINGEGAADDNLDTITNTDTADKDECILIKGTNAITVRDNSVSGGNIYLLNGGTKLLSATVGMKLIRIGTDWYEQYGEVTLTGTETLTNKTLTDEIHDGHSDYDIITVPSDPPADRSRVYAKQVDANNDGYFIKQNVAGTITEIRLA